MLRPTRCSEYPYSCIWVWCVMFWPTVGWFPGWLPGRLIAWLPDCLVVRRMRAYVTYITAGRAGDSAEAVDPHGCVCRPQHGVVGDVRWPRTAAEAVAVRPFGVPLVVACTGAVSVSVGVAAEIQAVCRQERRVVDRVHGRGHRLAERDRPGTPLLRANARRAPHCQQRLHPARTPQPG